MKFEVLQLKRLSAVISIWFLLVETSFSADGLIVEAHINEKPVRMMVNTASERSVLFASSAKRLGIKWTTPPAKTEPGPRKAMFRTSEDCVFSLGDSSLRSRFFVLQKPANVNFPVDGMIGWSALKSQIIKIEGSRNRILVLNGLPNDIDSWQRWPVRSNYDLLAIETDADTTVMIASSSDTAVELSPTQWKEWRGGLDDPVRTLGGFGTEAGVKVQEICFAKALSMGDLKLTDTLVQQDISGTESVIKNYAGVIGMGGLRGFDLIIDGINNQAYTLSISNPKPDFDYNRLGAVFVPQNGQSSDLVAHVIEGSPAHNSGIRNGDILTKINSLDVTKWQTDPRVLPLGRFWKDKPGTQIKLELRRGKEIHRMTVELVELFRNSDE